MSVTIPYHVVSEALLPSALGARVALNRQLGIPYKNSLISSEQTITVRVVNNTFKLPMPVNAGSLTPGVNVLGKYATLATPTTSEWIEVTGTMGYGTISADRVALPSEGNEIRVGEIVQGVDTGDILRWTGSADTFSSTDDEFFVVDLDPTLALLSDLITERVAELPDVVNDVNADINFIPRTIISGLEPMLRGFTY